MEDTSKRTPVAELAEIEQAKAEYLAAVKLAASKSGQSGYEYSLFEPIMLGNQKVEVLRMRPQTIRDIREANAKPRAEGTGIMPNDVLTAMLCGITPEQLLQLSVIDYEAVQEVMEGFTLRRAAGGLSRAS